MALEVFMAVTTLRSVDGFCRKRGHIDSIIRLSNSEINGRFENKNGMIIVICFFYCIDIFVYFFLLKQRM